MGPALAVSVNIVHGTQVFGNKALCRRAGLFFNLQLHTTACERDKILPSFSPLFLLSGLCISVPPSHLQINPVPTLGQLMILGLSGKIYSCFIYIRLCGLEFVLPALREHVGDAGWLVGGSHIHCLPALFCLGLCEMFGLKIMFAIGGCLLMATFVLICVVICLYCKLTNTLK